MIGKNRTSLRIPVYEGELHYFYSNYRDYYYLKKKIWQYTKVLPHL